MKIDNSTIIKKGSTWILRGAILALGLIVLAMCIFVLPSMWKGGSAEFPTASYALFLIMIGLYMTTIPFFFASWQALKLLSYIDKNMTFSEVSVKALKNIKYCAFTISALYIGGVPLLYPIADADDAPGLLIIGMAIACVPIVIGVFAAVLQRLLQEGLEMKSNPDNQKNIDLRSQIQAILGKELSEFSLQGKGLVNNAYFIRATDGSKYIVKTERNDKEFKPQNDLLIEAKVAQQLFTLNLSTPTPHVAFTSEHPKMYGYEYLEGELLRSMWNLFSEGERINICTALGHFHAEIGKKFTKEMAKASGININKSIELHPEVLEEYEKLMASTDVSEDFKTLAREAKSIFESTADAAVFQFIHNDSHHENILVKGKKISGIIDFGEAEYGEIAKEFSRYIRDFPNNFEYIVSAYEKDSGNKLSRKRLVTNSFLSGFSDIVEGYRKGGEDRMNAEKSVAIYQKLIST